MKGPWRAIRQRKPKEVLKWWSVGYLTDETGTTTIFSSGEALYPNQGAAEDVAYARNKARLERIYEGKGLHDDIDSEECAWCGTHGADEVLEVGPGKPKYHRECRREIMAHKEEEGEDQAEKKEVEDLPEMSTVVKEDLLHACVVLVKLPYEIHEEGDACSLSDFQEGRMCATCKAARWANIQLEHFA